MRSFATFIIALLLATQAMTADIPETVMVTYQVKPHQEGALKQVIDKHWQAAQRLKLVHTEPHIVVQGNASDSSYIVEIFTWRDGSAPDTAPKEITELWQQMNELTEARDGKPALDITVVGMVSQR
jgi:hypothetical protein